MCDIITTIHIYTKGEIDMARKSSTPEDGEAKQSKSLIADFLKKSQIKGLEMASVLSTSLLSNVSEWVSTGSLSLNKIISGDIYKGLPRGRIMAFAGPSGVGKTYLLMSSAREAQKQGYTILVLDSENAFDADSFRRLGGNPDEVLHFPVITVTECRNKCVQIMDEWMKLHPESKLFIIVDSLGGLTTEKVFEDIEKDEGKADMGNRAKQLREMAKVFTNYIAKHQAIMIVSNHTYEQPPPNPKMPPVVKFGGGEGFVYATSGIVFLKKSQIREEEVDAQGNSVKVKKGNILKATAEKNRFVPEGMVGEIYLSFETGLNKWYGLLNDALEAQLITEPSQGWYHFAHQEGNVRKKELYKTANWVGLIDKLAEHIRNKYKYTKFTTDEEIEATLGSVEKEEDKGD
jgi:RecA/RadA recombinase